MTAITATPPAVHAALRSVTWFGVRPATNAAAASTRPSGRFTNREYGGAPRRVFWCDASSRRAALKAHGPSRESMVVGAAIVASTTAAMRHRYPAAVK